MLSKAASSSRTRPQILARAITLFVQLSDGNFQVSAALVAELFASESAMEKTEVLEPLQLLAQATPYLLRFSFSCV